MDYPESKLPAANPIGSSAHASINNNSWHSLGLEDIFQSPRGRKKHAARKNRSNHSSRLNDFLRASQDASFPHEIAVYQQQKSAACDLVHDQPSGHHNFQSTMATVDESVGDTEDIAENPDSHHHLDTQEPKSRGDVELAKPKQLHELRAQSEESTTNATEDLTCSTDLDQSYTDIFQS